MKILISRLPACWRWFEADNLEVNGSAGKAREFKAILADYSVEASPKTLDAIFALKPGQQMVVDGAKRKKAKAQSKPLTPAPVAPVVSAEPEFVEPVASAEPAAESEKLPE